MYRLKTLGRAVVPSEAPRTSLCPRGADQPIVRASRMLSTQAVHIKRLDRLVALVIQDRRAFSHTPSTFQSPLTHSLSDYTVA